MKKELTDKVRISHVLDAIGEVEKYLNGVPYSDFLSNSEKRFATIKQVEIIGEACNRISKDSRISILKLSGRKSTALGIFQFMNTSASIIESCGRLLKMICLRLRHNSRTSGRK